MTSPAILDLDALLAPIPGNLPQGVPLPYEIRHKLEDFRREINPDDYDEDDPRRPTEYRKPNWSGIIALARDTLQQTSKDLLVAARLTEALTIERGIPGLRDGLALLRRLVEECWDRVYPIIEEGESPEVREGPFKWLNEATYGARFPTTVRTIPLLNVDGVRASVLDWQNSESRPGIESALLEVPEEQLRTLKEDLQAARGHLEALDAALHERMGELAPDWISSENTEHLGAALQDCWKTVQQWIQRKTGSSNAAVSTSSESPLPEAQSKANLGVAQTLGTRAEAYRMLHQAADLLQTIEPHSPIPYLVRRAIRLGQMKFPDLMRELIRESAVLDELERLMGLEKTSD
jgi:type VI secretion system protein ImpA